MISKLEIYGLIVLGLILAAIAAGAYERHVGYQERAGEDAIALQAANKRADEATEKLTQQGIQHNAAFETQRQGHEADLAAARAAIRPVIVQNCPRGGPVPSAAANPGSASSPAGGSTDVSVPAGRDIAAALLVLVSNAQNDRDKMIALQGWPRQ